MPVGHFNREPTVRPNHLVDCVVLLAASVAAVPDRLEGQADTTWQYADVQHRNECRLARQVLNLGQPANKREWALGVIPDCGPLGGQALGAALRNHHDQQTRDPDLERIVEAAARLQDRAIYEAAFDLARDPSAGTVARVQGIRVLYHQIHESVFQSYEALVSDPWETKSWSIQVVTSHGDPVATPLPDDHMERMNSMLRGVIDDLSTPRDVRVAARNLRASVEHELLRRQLCTPEMDTVECERLISEALVQQP